MCAGLAGIYVCAEICMCCLVGSYVCAEICTWIWLGATCVLMSVCGFGWELRVYGDLYVMSGWDLRVY